MSDNAPSELVLEAALTSTTRSSTPELDWEEISPKTDNASQGDTISEYYALIRTLRLRPSNVPSVYFDSAVEDQGSDPAVETGTARWPSATVLGISSATQGIAHHGSVAALVHLHGPVPAGSIIHMPGGGYYVSEQSAELNLAAPRKSFVILLTADVNTTSVPRTKLPISRMDVLLSELREIGEAREDWDGEGAPAPSPKAIEEAEAFVRAAGRLATRLEPALHADGSVLLEIGNGSEGLLRFKGDHRIVYAIRGYESGSVAFRGKRVPRAIAAALEPISR